MPPPALSKKFRYTSDWPIDKLIYRKSDSGSVPHATSFAGAVLYTYPHGLAFRPLCYGIYSEDNFNTHYEVGNDPWFTFNGGPWPRLSMVVSSDATNVYVMIVNFDTTRTLYWRIMGLAPSDATTSEITLPDTGQGGFIVNSDFNYTKLFMGGINTTSIASFGTATATITHNLGYKPMYLSWIEDSSGATFFSGTEAMMGVPAIQILAYITDTALICNLTSNIGSTTAAKVHYKIYLDE